MCVCGFFFYNVECLWKIDEQNYAGGVWRFVEILKNKLFISSQLFDLQAFGLSLVSPSTLSLAINVDEKLFWLDDGSKICV